MICWLESSRAPIGTDSIDAGLDLAANDETPSSMNGNSVVVGAVIVTQFATRWSRIGHGLVTTGPHGAARRISGEVGNVLLRVCFQDWALRNDMSLKALVMKMS